MSSPVLGDDGLSKETRFIQACKSGDMDTLQKMASEGLSVNCVNPSSHSPLIAATYSGQGRVVRWLLKQRANPNFAEKYTGGTALHKAALYNATDIMALLLAHKADPSIPDKPPHRCTPLHIAVKLGNVECIKLLIRAGADPRSRNDQGDTAESMALASDNPEIYDVLAKESGI
jgi:ankyrin repeat protein